MKSHTTYLTMNLPTKMGFQNITPEVDAAVKKSGVREGLALISTRCTLPPAFSSTTMSGACITTSGVARATGPIQPAPPKHYHHNRTGEDNADAHLKRQVMGREVVVAITNGKLDFGPWEQIFYGEFDGHRSKRVLIKIIGE